MIDHFQQRKKTLNKQDTDVLHNNKHLYMLNRIKKYIEFLKNTFIHSFGYAKAKT